MNDFVVYRRFMGGSLLTHNHPGNDLVVSLESFPFPGESLNFPVPESAALSQERSSEVQLPRCQRFTISQPRSAETRDG